MKNKIIVSFVTIVFIIFVGVITITKVKEVKVQASFNDTETENISEIYILKENNNNLGVFSSEGELLYEYTFNVNSLPKTDIEILKKGLTVYGVNELRAAIEDYTS